MAAAAVGRVLRREPPTHNNRILYVLCKSLDTYLLAFTYYTRVYVCIYRPTRERDELNALVPGRQHARFFVPDCRNYSPVQRVQ